MGNQRDMPDGCGGGDGDLLHRLMEHSGDVVLLHDLQGRCTYCGGAGRHGYAREGIVGKKPIDLLGDDRGRELQEALLEVARTGESRSVDSCSTCGAVQRWYRDRLYPVCDDSGRRIGVGQLRQDITEFKRLQESEQRHRIVSSLMSDYVYVADVSGEDPPTFADWIFGAFEEITGYRPEELQALPDGWYAIVHPDDLEILRRLQAEHFQNRSTTVEYRIITRPGQVRWLRDSSQPVYDASAGRVVRICGAVQDITERKQAEQALKDSESWFRALHDFCPVGLATIRLSDSRIFSVNEMICNMLGYTEQELLGKTVSDITHPDDLHLDEDAVAQRHAGQAGPLHYEKRLLAKDGRVVWIDLTSTTIQSGQEGEMFILGIVRDITAWKEAKQRLDESQDQLATAARLAGLGYWSLDVAEDRSHWSQECCSIFGVEPGREHSRQEFLDLVHPEDADRVESLHRNCLALREEAEIECRIVRADNGKTRHIKLVGRCTRDAAGKPVRVSGMVMDITRYREAEDALDQAHRQLRAVLDTIPAAVHVVDTQYRLLELNSEAMQATGCARREDVIGQKCYEVFRNSHAPCDDCAIPRVLETSRPTSRISRGNPLGKNDSDCKVFSSPILGGNGQGITSVVEVIMDITDLKQAEQSRREVAARAQRLAKLESLASLAGGIAHDFNNLLVAVMGNADLALRELPPQSSVRELMGEIKQASLRASELTGQMLAYSGRGQLVLKPFDLNALLREHGEMFRQTLSERIELRMDLQDGLPQLPGDRSQLAQVVDSLLNNAAEAIGSNPGSIQLTTHRLRRPGGTTPKNYVGEDLREGEYLVIRVKDTGCGMDEQTLGRLFDPFFTTKFTGRGLGLASALGITRGHGGGIQVDSRTDEGSVFQVLLPLPAQHETTPASPEAPEAAEDRSRPTLLFADDEANVRTIARRMLTRAGYNVLLAGDGREALDLFDEQPHAIDLVILDMVMPHCDGQEVLQTLRETGRDVPVLFCSGYAAKDLSAQMLHQPDGYIQKPFEMEHLLRVVAQTLRQRSPGV